ncbi:hypothetical protein DER44DRAFT_754497 [Fusarium oxysporum]|nr:hypothetical protein DER44DRAFT_754497 [Fusarium oxysporum]
MVVHHQSHIRVKRRGANGSAPAVSTQGLDRALEHLFVPRTLFLVPPSAITDSQLEDLMLPIEHIAVDIADSPDLFPLFEALARLPRLRTIIIIIPSDAVEEHQVINWQQEIRQDLTTLRRMSDLVDAPAPDGEWHPAHLHGMGPM